MTLGGSRSVLVDYENFVQVYVSFGVLTRTAAEVIGGF